MRVPACVRRSLSVFFGMLTLSATHSAPAQAEDAGGPGLENLLLQSTVRICSEREERGSLVVGHGTAFGVDLSRFGYNGKRFLLSAGHNVVDENGRYRTTLKLEFKNGYGAHWSPCKVMAYDRDLDVCLVEASEDLPSVLQLDTKELLPGSPVVLAGSPRGVPVAVFTGSVLRCYDRGTVRTAAQVAFDHGDSGGPFVSARSGKVSGVAVAGLPKDGDMDHTVGLFLPLSAIYNFMETNQRENAVPARSSFFAAETPRPAETQAVKCELRMPDPVADVDAANVAASKASAPTHLPTKLEVATEEPAHAPVTASVAVAKEPARAPAIPASPAVSASPAIPVVVAQAQAPVSVPVVTPEPARAPAPVSAPAVVAVAKEPARSPASVASAVVVASPAKPAVIAQAQPPASAPVAAPAPARAPATQIVVAQDPSRTASIGIVARESARPPAVQTAAVKAPVSAPVPAVQVAAPVFLAVANAPAPEHPVNVNVASKEPVRPAAQAAAAQTGSRVHLVVEGESLSKIAHSYGVSLQTLVQANAIANVNYIRAGAKLVIPVAN